MSAPTELEPFQPSQGFKSTASPNPNWTYGEGIESTPEGRAWMEGEKEGWKVVDTSDPSQKRAVYNIMKSGIVPRPIAFVSSVSEDGIENLAPFSWFNQVSKDPPLISIACSHLEGGSAKDTARNIKSGTGFTVNVISESWIDQANVCSTPVPFELSEWPISGLTKAPSIKAKAPRVKESAFVLECDLFQAIDIRHPTTDEVVTTLILGHVNYIHMRNDVIEPVRGIVDIGKLKPIARVGGITYAKVSEGFSLPSKQWKDIEEGVREKLGDISSK
ncbi:hypothetical protein D9613_008712 [Agrocybe pediades]|uniref:Flavin reductase like domain-containing protein n=1 Tax=Agrocybe pediades TaxID=84607 RepID=A0A8H4QTE4_9AGAR|nr:hypothetical protein D9613_008712 [Agrocybe pediades]